MAELDGELWNEKLDWGDFYREERQKQKAVLQARKQLEERIAQDSELQIEMWQRMMEQRDEDIHTFISSFLNNKRWHWVSAEINEREALERRMLVLIERHSYESMLDRFHKACEATHLLKLAYREKQERQEVEQLQRQEMEVKVQAWRQRREDVHRNLALMSTLDRELQAEFKEIHKSYARSHESVRFMRNVKDLQTKEAMMRDTIDKMEEEKRHLVYEKYHYAWQAVQEEETMASIREKYKEAEGAARAVWIREEAQARAAVVKARERQREVILQVQADVEEARRRETEALALAEELKQDYAEWKESAAFLSEVLEQEESAREEREVDENEAWQAFLQEVATFLREYREEEELYAIEQALEEWLWVEEQERACLADDEEADRAARVQGLRRALDAAYRATPAAQEFAALQRTLQREQEHFAAEYRESLAEDADPHPMVKQAQAHREVREQVCGPATAPAARPAPEAPPPAPPAGPPPGARAGAGGAAGAAEGAAEDMQFLGMLMPLRAEADGLSMLAEAGSRMSPSRPLTVASDCCTVPSRAGTPGAPPSRDGTPSVAPGHGRDARRNEGRGLTPQVAVTNWCC